jgi:Ca2+-binding RTX toxin-like protein
MATFTGTGGKDTITPTTVSVGVVSNPANTVPSAAADVIDGDGDNDTIDGGGGNDRIEGDAFGVTGDDSINGGSGDDTIDGNDGADTIHGGGGADDLIGQDGADVLKGGGNDDVLEGFEGNDLLTGDIGNDLLQGSTGKDTLEGGDGNDTLDGGPFDSGAGRDVLTGGDGQNLFRFSQPTDGKDTITDFDAGADLLQIDASRFGGGLLAGQFDADQLVVHASNDPSTTAAGGQFVLNTNTSVLLWDDDGLVGGTVAIAKLSGVTKLEISDFDIIA